MAEIFLTKEGKEEKQKRLEYLKTVRRAEVAEEIKAAKEYGDLSENAEYDLARSEQNKLELEIAQLEDGLRLAKVVDVKKRSLDIIGIGSKVKIQDIEFKENLTYTIVGALESDPLKQLISNQSPIGSALMGKKVGDKIAVKTPSGESKFKVLSIE